MMLKTVAAYNLEYPKNVQPTEMREKVLMYACYIGSRPFKIIYKTFYAAGYNQVYLRSAV